ncbi:uncharacterized protein LOC108672799 [Hyalella azteca]|uniref:Uncharacterized protein LOC108672799 n=1 Tax=Hyalella azteca TaxID=294128 RepID=A0A8B7NQP1_HYAAZ|nr:uncharacterized protein LOC108672799 [Hyalella azteca]
MKVQVTNKVTSLSACLKALIGNNGESSTSLKREKSILNLRAVYEFAQELAAHPCKTCDKEQLQGLLDKLFTVVAATPHQVPFDASVLASSSIAVLLEHLYPTDADKHLYSLFYNVLTHYPYENLPNFSKLSSAESKCSCCTHGCIENFNDQILLAWLHGLVKVMPAFLFKKSTAFSIIDIFILLDNLVSIVDASWLYQLFVVFELWTEKVKDKINMYLSEFDFEHDQLGEVNELLLSICSLHEEEGGSLLKILSNHWESPVKGVPGLCIKILSNVISIFDTLHANPSTGADLLCKSVFQSGLWSSRAAYSTLQAILIGRHLTAVEMIGRGGKALCEGMCSGLRSSHLAMSVTALYKLLLVSLPEPLWMRHFWKGFLSALTSDIRVTQHNCITLWLPITLRHYSLLLQGLLTSCPDTDAGWLARIAILKNSDSALTCHVRCLVGGLCQEAMHQKEGSTYQDINSICNDSLCTKIVVTEMSTTPDSNGSGDKFSNNVARNPGVDNSVLLPEESSISESPAAALCPANVLLEALSHPVSAVRADAFALLCQPDKPSTPVTELEAHLIRNFLVFNINIDCSIFRLSLVKSFKHLLSRLKTTIYKGIRPFKLFLEADTKIPLDEIGDKLFTCSKLVLWFVRFLHNQLISRGNYQRIILSLQLYKELLIHFSSEISKDVKPNQVSTIVLVKKFLDLHSIDDAWLLQEYLFQPQYRQNLDMSFNFSAFSCPSCSTDIGSLRAHHRLRVCDLTLPYTVPLMMSLLIHEMNDVRDESECILMTLSDNAWLQYLERNAFSGKNESLNDITLRAAHLEITSKNKYKSFCLCSLLEYQNESETPKNSIETIETSPTGISEVRASDYKEISATKSRFGNVRGGGHACMVLSGHLKDAFALLDSPKMSVAESGALVLRVLITAIKRMSAVLDLSLEQVLLQVPDISVRPNPSTDDDVILMIRVLLSKAARDLAAARHNLLHAATSAPVHGTLLAIHSVLQTNGSIDSSAQDIYAHLLTEVLLLSEEAVEFMLGRMALAASEGSAVAPSFSEISESIEAIIQACKSSNSSKPETEVSADIGIDIPPHHCDDDEFSMDCGAISGEHQLVLSCCWQTIKAACLVSSTVISLPYIKVCDYNDSVTKETSNDFVDNSDVSDETSSALATKVNTNTTDIAALTEAASSTLFGSNLGKTSTNWNTGKIENHLTATTEKCFIFLPITAVQRAVSCVLLRTLTGTRHKGAIEAAKICLTRVASALLTNSSTYDLLDELLHCTLVRELALDSGDAGAASARRSVTRRAAGLAMLSQALCVADHNHASRGSPPRLLLHTLHTLLQHACHGQQESEGSDCRCSVVLHLLQGIVQQLQHCHRLDDIATACIAAFTSSCWRCRNAGLQLFGSVVTRLVGQKKVADDSSDYNSLIAPQFIASHPDLTRALLKLLRQTAFAVGRSSGSCYKCKADSETVKFTALQNIASRNSSHIIVDSTCPLASEIPELENINRDYQITKSVCDKASNSERGEENDTAAITTSVDKNVIQKNAQAEKNEVELSSVVIPVLCLLSRLSPGLQLCDDQFKEVIAGFQESLRLLLGSSIFYIRSLAAKSLLSLIPRAEQTCFIEVLLDKLYEHSGNPAQASARDIVREHNCISSNERNGFLLLLKYYIQRTKIPVDSIPNENPSEMLCSVAAKVFMRDGECFINRSLACECLMHLNDYSLFVDKLIFGGARLHHPGSERFLELTIMYQLRAAPASRREITVSTHLFGSFPESAKIAADFWVKELQVQNYPLDDSDWFILENLLKNILYCELNMNSANFLRTICRLFDSRKSIVKDMTKNFDCHGMCHHALMSVLRGDLNAAAQRDLLTLMSYLLSSLRVSFTDDVLMLFSKTVLAFSQENAAEVYRLCSAKCVGLLLPRLMTPGGGSLVSLKENLVKIVCDLLYDEDPYVRSTASLFLSHIAESSLIHKTHPNKALVDILDYIAEQCCLQDDVMLLESLWREYKEVARTSSGIGAKTKNCGKSYLFESQSLNLYKESSIMLQLLQQALFVISSKGSCALRDHLTQLHLTSSTLEN